MADKKMNQLPTASDCGYIYAETSSGEQVRISKADLASVVAGLIGNIELYLPAGSEYTFPITGGMIAIASESIQNACALVAFPLYGGGCAVSNILGNLYVEGNVTTSYKISCWRDEQGCHIRNNWPNSGFRFYYSVVGSKVQ